MFHRKDAVLRPLGQPQTITFEWVTLDRCGAVVNRADGSARQVVEDLGGGVELELIAVPGGSFQMGSRHEGGYADEQPLHPVFLDGFWMARTPVTQAQWRAVMGRLPGCRFTGDELPVENICWKDAAVFCERLSRHTGRRYRLPSEAQWEYACRAGTSTLFSTGETITTDYANFVGTHPFRDEPPGVNRHIVTPVGSFLPNPWGLADMHGGLWEFCQDVWADDYTGASPLGDARETSLRGASREVTWRVARGGSWHEPHLHCRSAMRLRVAEDDRAEYYGMRVVLMNSE